MRLSEEYRYFSLFSIWDKRRENQTRKNTGWSTSDLSNMGSWKILLFRVLGSNCLCVILWSGSGDYNASPSSYIWSHLIIRHAEKSCYFTYRINKSTNFSGIIKSPLKRDRLCFSETFDLKVFNTAMYIIH